MAGRVELVIERERLPPRLVDGLDQVAELGRETPRADQLEVRRPPEGFVLGPPAPHHVHVELRHDRVARHGGMIGEVL